MGHGKSLNRKKCLEASFEGLSWSKLRRKERERAHGVWSLKLCW